MKDGKAIGYLYRERPDNEGDSGWRVFSGEETQEYADNPNNFLMYNASTLIELDQMISPLLSSPYPIAFERDGESGGFFEVPEPSEE